MYPVSFCLLVFVSAAFGEETAPYLRKRCPGGHEEGATATVGRYWYECRDGQLVPKGCLDDQRNRIGIGASYDTLSRTFRMQCVLDSNGYLAFTYKSCLVDGREYGPGQEWEDSRYFYRCDREGEYLQINTAGCMDEGRRVTIQERVVKGSFVYQCRRSSVGTCSMCPVACMKYGHEYAIGESFDADNLWYTCAQDGGRLMIKAVGCLNDRKERTKDGDRYFKDDVVFECQVREDQVGARPVGCVQRDEKGTAIERRLGCYWIEGNAPYQYEMTCKEEGTNRAVKVQSRCNYKSPRGTYLLDGGCYQVADQEVVACKKVNDQLTLRVVPFAQISQITAEGLRVC
jgi:hypothetical protein